MIIKSIILKYLKYTILYYYNEVSFYLLETIVTFMKKIQKKI
jgi:hypothetical protein